MTLYDGGDGNDGDVHGSHGGDDGVLQYSRIFVVCLVHFLLEQVILDFDLYVEG